MKYLSRNLKDTRDIAKQFLATLKPLSDKATIIGLRGDLGSGKTAFTQAVARELGVQDRLTSPTFVILKKYKLPKNKTGFKKLTHIDCYRLKNGRDMLSLGWSEFADNPLNLIFIEWPEIIADILPKGAKMINFRFINENTREIILP